MTKADRPSFTPVALLAVLAIAAGSCGSDRVLADRADEAWAPAPTVTVPTPTTGARSSGITTPTTKAPSTSTSTSAPTTTPAERTTPLSNPGGELQTEGEPGPAGDLDGLTDPASLASALSVAEIEIRNPDNDAQTARLWGERQQRLYRLLSRDPALGDQVVELVSPAVRFAVSKNWEARKESSALVNSRPLSTTLPAWRITAPLPADVLVGYYKAASDRTGVPWEVLAAINLVETRMGRIEGLSTAGAVGPMQFLPSTWNECCEGDPTVPEDAIHGAAHYLTVRGAPEDLPKAVRGYNNSAHYVRAVLGYASVIEENPLAYRGYHAWQVYYLSASGLVRLPVGYEQDQPVDAQAWIEAHPQALADR